MLTMSEKVTVSLQTLGCKLNQAESEKISQQLEEAGFAITQGGKADIFILNTCTVTQGADSKGRHLIRVLRKGNPKALIVVTGCYAERTVNELNKCGADMVVGNARKMQIAELVQGQLSNVIRESMREKPEEGRERVRSFIKIQDGCHNYCSYCIVPFVRSDVYSVDAGEVIETIKERVADGYREVVLTGTEIGVYSSGGQGLQQLIERILAETEVARLHISSLQPQEVSIPLLELWQDRRLCRHFHMALQSGSNAMLKRMRRRYDKNMYRESVERIRSRLPDASITADVIVGFPAESEAEFQESYEFCRDMEFAALHVFPYSPRPGTAAASMTGQVKESVKRQRSLQMLELAASSAERFARKFIDQIKAVLWENEVRPCSGIYSGLTDNYIRVYAKSPTDLTNTISRARLRGPAREAGRRVLKASTRGNYGELWSEVSE